MEALISAIQFLQDCGCVDGVDLNSHCQHWDQNVMKLIKVSRTGLSQPVRVDFFSRVTAPQLMSASYFMLTSSVLSKFLLPITCVSLHFSIQNDVCTRYTLLSFEIIQKPGGCETMLTEFVMKKFNKIFAV